MRPWPVIAVLMVALLGPVPARSQYIFLDVDGDGASTSADRLDPKGSRVDVVIETDKSADGTPAAVGKGRQSSYSINSYEFILRAEGGTVQWGEYTNLRPSMTIPLGQAKDNRQFYVGYAGEEALPPGKYILGRLSVRPVSGRPRIVFGQQSSLNPRGHTSFGSQVLGKDLDNTLKFAEGGSGPARVGNSDYSGDWADARGLDSPDSTDAPQAVAGEAVIERLEVIPAGSPLTPDGTLKLRVPTRAPITLRLFDVSGRLVGSVLDGQVFGPGEYAIPLTRLSRVTHISAGVYFYQLRGGPTLRTGHLVVLK